jgi:hypothetical protein
MWVRCGSWAALAQDHLGIKYEHYNLADIELGAHASRRLYKKIFVCQSRPWTPGGGWDRRFYCFLRDLYVRLGCRSVDFLGPHTGRLRRGFFRDRT